MSVIIGVSDGHDAGAAVIDQDGNIISAVSEERFSRIKHQRGIPYNSLQHIKHYLEENDLADEMIYIAVGGIFRREKRCKEFEQAIEALFPSSPIIYIGHHLSHAASAYFTSGFNKALVITLDAAGDGLSGSLSIGINGRIIPLYNISYINSVGDFFASITEFLGYKPMSDEHKVASMAAYGDSEKYLHLMREIIDIDINRLTFKNLLGFVGHRVTKYLKNKINTDINHFDLAAAAQKHLLDLVIRFFEKAIELYNIRKVVFAGGIAGNVQLNMYLKELELIEDLWVFPHMGDGGLPVGAALEVLSRIKQVEGKHLYPKKLSHVYLGPQFSENAIKETISKFKNSLNVLEVSREDEIPKLIEENKIVGLFQGRMEFGPRALGNRSVLANPIYEENKKWINMRKRREWFQPLAPTILNENAHEYLLNSFESRFMTFAFMVTEKALTETPAIVHKDNTTRPQTLCDENPKYREIITQVSNYIGVPIVINTSLNMHGEPIVCSPEDAIMTLKKGLVDVLFIEDFMLLKK